MIRHALPLVALLMAAPGQIGTIVDPVRVIPLTREGRVLVSFTLQGGVAPEMLDAIRSGLETSYVYDLELRRDVSVWFDRTLATATVTASVQYDNLTRRYTLSRSIDGRVDAAEVTDVESDVERWITSADRLSLFSTAGLEPNAEYYVRVRARARPRATWSFWPWGGGQWGHATFTFIP